MAKEKVLKPAQAGANRLLWAYAAARQERLNAQAALILEMERLKALSPFWEGLEEAYRLAQEKEDGIFAGITSFEAEFKEDLFAPTGTPPESLKVELPGGDLFYSLEEYVVKRKGVLALLERYGFEEAIRRTAAVDWDALADKVEWPDEALGLIGTERKKRESFSFEVREES